MWKDIKTEITRAYELVTKEREHVSEEKQPWIAEDTLLIIEQHRQSKSHDDNKEYRLMNRSVQQCCRRDREPHCNQSGNEIQEHAHRNETSAVYKKICHIDRDFNPRTREIKEDDGTVAWDSKEIMNSWKT